MAVKYWFVAGNGNSNWNSATAWFNGSGGTGGVTTTPVAGDDAILDSASGSGILTVSAVSVCNSLNMTGFTGTFAGASPLTISGANVSTVALLINDIMSVTYNSTITFSGVGGHINTGSKSMPFNVTISSTGTVYTMDSDLLLDSTKILTVNNGTFTATNCRVGLFVSTGASTRVINIITLDITGIGTCFNTSATLSTFNINSLNILDASSSTKTIVGGTTTASININLLGNGTGGYLVGGTFSVVSVKNTGGASFNFNTATTIDSLDFTGSSNTNWNNTANTLTIKGALFKLVPSTILTALPTLLFTGTTTFSRNGNTQPITSGVSVNAPAGGVTFSEDPNLTGTLTLTAGSISGTPTITCGIFSSNNSNIRSINCTDLILTGSGSITVLTTTTNLSFNVTNIRVDGTSSSLRTLNLMVFVNPLNIYFQGMSTGTLSINPAGHVATANVNIYVTNTGGARLSFSSGYISRLEFVTGTNVIWDNATGQTMSFFSATPSGTTGLYMAVGVPTPALTPAIDGGLNGNTTTNICEISLNGNTLVGGTLTCRTNTTMNIISPFNTTGGITVNPGALGNGFINVNTNVFNVAGNVSCGSGEFIISSAMNNSTMNWGSLTLSVNAGRFYCRASDGVSNITLNIGTITASSATNLVMENMNIFISGSGVALHAGSAASFTGSIITFTDTSNNDLTLTPFTTGKTFPKVVFNRGNSIGNIIIQASSIYGEFTDLGTAAHSILFTAGTTQTIDKFNVSGSGPGNEITLTSTTTATFALVKSPAGIVLSDYLNISHSIATPTNNTWYAGTHSIDNQAIASAGSGWIFSIPPRRLGLMGVGGGPEG